MESIKIEENTSIEYHYFCLKCKGIFISKGIQKTRPIKEIPEHILEKLPKCKCENPE